MIEIDSLEKSSGKIIYSSDRQDILSLPVEKIKELFKLSGLLIFKGFDVSCDQMKAFSKQFTSRYIRDSNRTFVDDFLGLVDQGMYALGPHCENGTTAFRPDAVWFCCAVPAKQGGETLFWDGVRVWEELSEELKQLFISKKKIIFSNWYPAEAWKHFLGTGATLDDVKQKLNSIEGLTYAIAEDLSISIEFALPSALKTKYGDREVFAHSFMMEYSETGEMDYFKTGTVKFEDGSLIPETAVYEIQEVLDRLTEVIPLQAGELVMVDNSRFLHGRRAFNDERRQIFSLLSYLNF
ncbi:MAG: TauD/TfdA family dioxygenase [Hydrococcus sp. Prado102]|jgi:hypothetical protein|nr:TauD/TfdA family dioxygenase [Hydrococcus sp. Prado102]